MPHDVIVIGAGPAGLIAASEAARKVEDVLVTEEHERVGEPDHCAGLLSVTGLKTLGLAPPAAAVQNRVNGARIYSPSGNSFLVTRGRREAVVVDRRVFDQWLADTATGLGVKVLTRTRVTGVCREANGITGVHMGETELERSSVLIDAEGAGCQISKAAGLPAVERKCKHAALQYEVRNADVDDDVVEMFYSRRIAPGFFAWIVPLGDRRARVGLAARDRPVARLDAAIRHHPVFKSRLSRAVVERRIGGVVLVGLPVRKTFCGGFMVVGDAAGMTKPTTGGGVIVGGSAARIAGRTAARAVSEADTSAGFLREYEVSWQAVLLRELRAMYLAQTVLRSLSDKGLDLLIRDANDTGMANVLSDKGDMDMQGRAIAGLLLRPESIVTGLRALRYVSPL